MQLDWLKIVRLNVRRLLPHKHNVNLLEAKFMKFINSCVKYEVIIDSQCATASGLVVIFNLTIAKSHIACVCVMCGWSRGANDAMYSRRHSTLT